MPIQGLESSGEWIRPKEAHAIMNNNPIAEYHAVLLVALGGMGPWLLAHSCKFCD